MTPETARLVARQLLEEQEELGKDGNASLDQEALDALATLASSKLLWEQGNLFTGDPYGVKVEEQFGSSEIHGPFSTENDAWNYGMNYARAATPFDGFVTVKIVKLTIPEVKVITTAEAVKEAREDGLIP